MQSFFSPIGGLIGDLLSPALYFFPNADSTTLTFINSQVTQFNTLMAYASWIFPVTTAFLLIKLALAIEVVILGIRISLWIISILTLGIVKNKI